jgi:NAD(P)-dependent dehydrogenase (short-subunit alcohol dehydrogenase family)
MALHHWGGVISISSVQALAKEGRVGPYAASQGGISRFTKFLAIELEPHQNPHQMPSHPGVFTGPCRWSTEWTKREPELFKEWYVKNCKIPPGAAR